MDWFKKNITPIIIASLLAAVGSLFGLGYAQTDKKIDTKASKEELVLTIEKLEALRKQSQEQYKEERSEQKTLNNNMLQTLQQLNLQIILLNERLKREVKHED